MQLKVGDWVEVVIYGQLYATYDKMAKIMKLEFYVNNRYPKYNNRLIGQVKAIEHHLRHGYVIAGIRIESESGETQDYMYGVRGLEIIPVPRAKLIGEIEELLDEN